MFLSTRGWLNSLRWTVFGTGACLGISLSYNWIYFQPLGSAAIRQGLISATVLPIALAAPLFFFLSVKLRELAIANLKLAHQATRDGLTGLLNRSAFAACAEETLSVVRAGVGLLIIDVDDFKHINDRHGHATGDEALRVIAEAIKAPLRNHDACGRLGGEEFGVLFRDITPLWAEELGRRVCESVSKVRFHAGEERVPLSVSVGCATSDGALTFAELFRVADERLYAAKRAGKARVIGSNHFVESQASRKSA